MATPCSCKKEAKLSAGGVGQIEMLGRNFSSLQLLPFDINMLRGHTTRLSSRLPPSLPLLTEEKGRWRVNEKSCVRARRFPGVGGGKFWLSLRCDTFTFLAVRLPSENKSCNGREVRKKGNFPNCRNLLERERKSFLASAVGLCSTAEGETRTFVLQKKIALLRRTYVCGMI